MYCFCLHAQNPGLSEVDLEPDLRRGKWQDQDPKTRKKRLKESKSCCTAWSPVHGKVDFQPGAKRGTNKTRALVSLYWLPWTLHLKQSPNHISHKSTKVDPIRLPWFSKKSDQIPKSYAFQHIKTTKSTNAHDGDYKWGRHTQR